MTSGTGSGKAGSCRRRSVSRRAGGHTLLEILAALLVMAILMGAAAGLVFRTDGFRLAHARDEVTGLARRAARLAAADGRDRFLRFADGECRLVAADGTTVEEAVVFPEEARLGLRQFGQDEFRSPGREGFSWTIGASGLASPLSVRLELGEDEWEVDFGPLAAGVIETRSTSYR